MKPQEFIQCRTGKVIRTRQGYWAFIPNSLPPALNWTPRLVSRLSEASAALGELAATSRYLQISPICIVPFYRREARYSSIIDELESDPVESDLAIATVFPPRQHTGYEQALDYGGQLATKTPFSLEGLKAVHARLMTEGGDRESAPGTIRTSQNWVGPPGSTVETAPFVPPPADRLDSLLARLETFAGSATHLPPLIRIGMLHYQLEAIHPFTSGNGRTGRIITSTLLAAWGGLPYPLLHLSSYFEKQRQEYFDHLMAVSQESAWEAWLVFFLQSVIAEARQTQKRLHSLTDLRERYRQMTASNRAAARLLAVVDHLFSQPVTSINQTAAALEVNFAVAQRYIQQLEAGGIIREITGQARHRLYFAEDIQAALENRAADLQQFIVGK
jgi:Fic family protein